MTNKSPRPKTISPAEFDLCVLLNTRPGNQSSPDLLTAMRRVMVEGMSQADARGDIPTLSKQALYNGLARMSVQYSSRIASLSADQFELGIRMTCPEISPGAKALAKVHLESSGEDLPLGDSNSAIEAREAIEKLRAFHIQVLSAYTPT